MANILIIDDRVVNRQFLVTLLGYKGHRLVEAADGAEGLALARAERPDLIISDVLMPTMDGYEFVKRLREDPLIGNTNVIFSSAHYLSLESKALARKCGIEAIISKPCEPQIVLDIVDQALSRLDQSEVAHDVGSQEFDREHVQLLTNNLADKTNRLREASAKLLAVIQLSNELANERDPEELLDRYCSTAREVVGASCALVFLLSQDLSTLKYVRCAGIDVHEVMLSQTSMLDTDSFKRLTNGLRSIRLSASSLPESSNRLPTVLQHASSLLIAPLEMRGHVNGWICLGDKLGLNEFTAEDEDLLSAFAAQMMVAYDNARLYDESVKYAARLESEISERRAVEEQLTDSQARLANIIDSAIDGIVTVDEDHCVVMFNRAAETMFGYTSTEIQGQPVDRLMPERFRAGHSQHIRRFATDAKNGVRRPLSRPITGLRNNGEEFSLEGSISQINVSGQKLFTIIMRDITERKRAEAQLQNAKEYSERLIQTANVMIIGLDTQGSITVFNEAAERITGYSATEVRYTNWFDKLVPRDKFPKVVREFQRLIEGGQPTAFENPIIAKNGEARHIAWQNNVVMVDGKVAGTISCGNDITEQRQLEDQLRQSQKLEAIGQLAGGVAHDFNNLLTAINGYSEIAIRRLPETNPTRGYLEEIQKAGTRAANLTRQLLAFGRKQMLQPVVMSLNDVVTDMNKMLQRLIGEDVKYDVKLDPLLSNIKADPGQIEQVLVNLVLNARDAMPQGGTLSLETMEVNIEASSAKPPLGLESGPYVVLSVADTGTGMSEETKERIFEPFFTTKEKDKGTGLGLSTVYGIVTQSGGDIQFTSELGCGTTFKVYLPQYLDSQDLDPRKVSETEPVGGSETILVVEDADAVRELTREILESVGYHVLTANCGDEAFTLSQSHPEPIDLLLTDVVMPGTCGKDTAQKLTSMRPGMRVLYMSGYTDDAIVHHGIVDSSVEFIQKPFSPSSLMKKVREVLEASTSANQ